MVVIVSAAATSLQKPKPLIVNKCCGEKKILTIESHQCSFGGDDDWWPIIFQILKQSYFEPKGTAPRFMKYREWRPYCKTPEYFEGSHKMALFSNGSLYLSEKHKFIDPHNFCVDKDSAIICDPDSLQQSLKLRKNSSYKAIENTCAPSNADTTHLINSTNTDILFGFPECKVSKYFTEIFNESNLDRDTNRLMLKTGKILEWKDFCIEHVENEIEKSLHVFTCAHHLSLYQNTEGFPQTVTL